MGVLVYVLGRSGTGKSYSMRNFNKEDIGVVNVQGKILPFKGSGAWDIESTDKSEEIVTAIKRLSKKHKTVVVDDFQYVMANEFMRRSTEKTWDKFTDIARHAWDIANAVRTLPADVVVYILCHTDTDQDGFEKLKTIGKLLDEKIVLEGMSTIVLKTAVSDGQYMFLTQNNGKDTVKSPAGMFPSYAIDNDLKYVDEKIRGYYELGGFTLTDEEMAEIDEAAKKDNIPIKEEPKKRGRRGKAKEEELAEAPAEEKKEEAAGEAAGEVHESSGGSSTADNSGNGTSDGARTASGSARRRRKVKEEQIEALANNLPEGDKEEVPFEETKEPELPTRKRRKTSNIAYTTLYYKRGDEYFVVNEGDVIPNPAEGYKEITKDQYEAATAAPAETAVKEPEGEAPEEKAPITRRRRRRA